MNQSPKTLPIDQGVQVNVWQITAKSGKTISFGDIQVDTQNNSTVLSGPIAGVMATSKFYFRAFDIHPGGSPETSAGPLVDRVQIE
jgi:hypothetical protein